MKKFLLFTIAFLCAIAINATSPAKGDLVLSSSETSIQPLYVTPGDGKAIAYVYLTNNEPNYQFCGFQADIYLPGGISIVKATYSLLTQEEDVFGELVSTHSIEVRQKSDHWFTLCFSSVNKAFAAKNGAVMKLYLGIPQNFTGGTAQFKNIIFSAVIPKGQTNPFDTSNGVDGSTFNIYSTQSSDVKATGITLNNSSLALNPGQTSQLTATVLPSNATNKSVTWKSSNTSVATVSSTGLVTAVSKGNASVTATTADGTNLSASCQVTVTAAPTPSGKAAKGDLVLSGSETSIQPLFVTPGDTKAVAYVYLTNNEPDYEFCGFQADIYLPEGVSIVKATTSILTQEEDIFGELTSTHSVEIRQKSDHWFTLCFSSVNKPFAARNGSVMKLYLNVPQDFSGGIGQFKNIIFSAVIPKGQTNPFDTAAGVDGTEFAINTAASKAYSIYAENATASKGSTFTLPILMDNEKSISDVQFDIELPQGLSIPYEIVNNNPVYMVTKGSRAKADHIVYCEKLRDMNHYRVIISSTTNTTFNDADKSLPIANITLEVANDVNPGNLNITLDNIVLSHYDATTGTSKHNGAPQTVVVTIINTFSIAATAENPAHGSVTITGSTYNPSEGTAENGDNITLTAHAADGYVFWKWVENGAIVSTINPYTFTLTSNRDIKAVFTKLGDVYEDNIVDIADLTSTVGIILNGEDIDLRTFRAADVYTDGIIDVADYTNTIEIIFASDYNSKADFTSVKREIANMQFDVELPAGLNITTSDLQVMLSNSVIANNHNVAVSMLDNGMIRVLVVSPFNEEIRNAINSLKALNLVSSTLQGEYDVMLHNMVLAYNDYTKEVIDGMNVKFMFANPTGISSISSSENINGNIYNLNGQKMNSIHKGVNIVNGKKFIVK